jgi:sec-independent protein translocase protein TatC
MTPPSELDTATAESGLPDYLDNRAANDLSIEDDELPDEVEMSLFDHLEELRQRIFYSLIAVVIGMIGCFIFVKPLVQLLEVPAKGVKFLQLAPGEFFFVSLKVAGYSGLLVASPFVLYQIILFVLPGLTRREQRFIGPVVFGSTFLFLAGLVFSYSLLTPAALNFFINYGEDVVEQLWSIDKYFEFVLLLLFSTGLAFQIPVIQILLGLLGIVTAKQMLSVWRFVLLGSAVLGAVLTPSTDPLTQSLLAGAVIGLYFGGIGLVALLVNARGLEKLIGLIINIITKPWQLLSRQFGGSSSQQKLAQGKENRAERLLSSPTVISQPLDNLSEVSSIDIVANASSEESPAIPEIQAEIKNGSEPEDVNPLPVDAIDIENEQEVSEVEEIKPDVTELNLEQNGSEAIAPIPTSDAEAKLSGEELQTPSEEEINNEPIEEQAIPQILPKRFQSKAIGALFTLLDLWCQDRGQVGIKWAVTLKLRGEDWVTTPDLSYISYERLPKEWIVDEACPNPPELVVDIISAKQTFGELIDRATDYLEAGVLRVWFVDIQARSITVFYSDARPRTYSAAMNLTDSLFEGLELIPELVFPQTVKWSSELS